MSTKISFQTWSGGEGWNDERYLIGYCKEPSIDVLKKIILTHNVHYYNELYRPIDDNFPNNVEGLVIEEFSGKCLGITVTGNFEDLNLAKAITESNRTKETILKSLHECRKWNAISCNEEQKNQAFAEIDLIKKYVEDNIK